MNGKYQKLSQIGLGPQSAVYRARQVDLNRDVALKELRGEWQANAGSRERFFREADRWAALSNDNLARIHDVDRDRGWVILELFASSLVHQIQKGPADVRLVRGVLEQALEGLLYLHGRGFLHGNIKPSNLLCDERMRVRLADGRCIAAADGGELPAPAAPYKYVAPELVAEDAGSIGPPADLYCLGFVGLELLAGPRFASLFRGVESETGAGSGWMRWHSTLGDRAPDARSLSPEVDEGLARTLEGLLRKRVSDRWRDAREALAELRRVLPPKPSPAGSSGALPAYNPSAPGATPKASSSPGTQGGAHPAAPRRPGAAPQPSAPATLVERPDFPMVLRVVSGCKAGIMLGFSQDVVRVGSEPDCELRFNPEDDPGVSNRRISFRKELDGWRVYAEREGIWHNQAALRDSAEIRSGDILRLSIQGPDVQFVLHTPGTPTLVSLAQKHGLAKAAKLAADVTANAPVNPAPLSAAAPQAGMASAPRVAAASAPAASPSPSAENSSPAPHPAAPRRPTPNETSAAPSSFWIGEAPAVAPQTKGQGGAWFDVSKWDKNTKNWVTLGLGMIVVVIVAVLWPSGESAPTPEPQRPPASAAKEETPAAKTPLKPMKPPTAVPPNGASNPNKAKAEVAP